MDMRKKVIWLCSWYPNETDWFTGDFIQRQAMAASLYADIEVVHMANSKEERKVVSQVNSHLRETIYYSKSSSKIFQYKDFFQLHESFISDYLSRKGKPDLIHVHIPIRSGLIALRWKKNYDWPFVLTEHYGIYNKHVKDRFEKRNYLFRHFTRKIIKEADFFFPVSQFLGECVNQFAIQKEFHVIPNVVDTTLFFPKARDRQGKFRFIHISDGSEIKNFTGILKAIEVLQAKRNDFEIVCIGMDSSKYQKWLAARVWSEEVVKILPPITYAEVAAYVHSCDAGILFSREETQSCVVLEWLCAGKPVIASNAGGVCELINETNGYLLESENVQQLALAMSTLIDNYQSFDTNRIARNATEKYSYEAVGKLLNTYYLNY
jgi:glycosyltransferase involved in cell wall biosynthesis